MTPGLYARLGKRLEPRFGTLWGALLVCVLVVIGTSFFLTTSLLKFLFGLGTVGAMLAWGAIMAVYWFGPNSFGAPHNRRGLGRAVAAWLLAMILSLWFLFALAVSPVFLGGR